MNWLRVSLNGLSDHGIKVPEDFEIITSDDSQVTRYTRPNLSTIGQPLYDLGAVGMRMLTKIMHKEELEEREVLLSPYDQPTWNDQKIRISRLESRLGKTCLLV